LPVSERLLLWSANPQNLPERPLLALYKRRIADLGLRCHYKKESSFRKPQARLKCICVLSSNLTGNRHGEIMARITFNLDELVGILISNKLLPGEIIRARVKGERIHFVIRTNSFVLPFIPASLRYLSFDNNSAIFELNIVGGHVSKAMGWLSQVLKINIPEYMKLEYPKISIDVDKLLKKKNIRGVRVKDIFFKDSEFTIVTCSI